MSTHEAFDHVIACLRKGCLHSYPGVEGYTTDKIHPETKLPQFYCLQGTSKNEAYHRLHVGFWPCCILFHPHLLAGDIIVFASQGGGGGGVGTFIYSRVCSLIEIKRSKLAVLIGNRAYCSPAASVSASVFNVDQPAIRRRRQQGEHRRRSTVAARFGSALVPQQPYGRHQQRVLHSRSVFRALVVPTEDRSGMETHRRPSTRREPRHPSCGEYSRCRGLVAPTRMQHDGIFFFVTLEK